jgi:hypothetical protein
MLRRRSRAKRRVGAALVGDGRAGMRHGGAGKYCTGHRTDRHLWCHKGAREWANVRDSRCYLALTLRTRRGNKDPAGKGSRGVSKFVRRATGTTTAGTSVATATEAGTWDGARPVSGSSCCGVAGTMAATPPSTSCDRWSLGASKPMASSHGGLRRKVEATLNGCASGLWWKSPRAWAESLWPQWAQAPRYPEGEVKSKMQKPPP